VIAKAIPLIKRIVSILLAIASLYVLIFLDDYLSIAVLIILIIYFHKEIVIMLKYHGAEHKCINMYEAIDDLSDLTVEFASTFPRTHMRCGTNIISLLIPLSILYYFAAERLFALITTGNALYFLGSILLLGICIELFRLFQKPLMQWIFKPGIYLQRFVTTREPDNGQLEVAIKALEAVL
jgi:Predicted metal-dependent enzyme